ncbi:YybH family protein [Amycolatopsis sp. CA-126428]|uniref:YybH family protein n=1 Tax=Amycolatopsis sp. CA-126428 TaxID=2073158 RepID=UPI000CD286F7|nr:nuclear transport factor 2 family protein [Amycolatopsis sp. CA-126428]
MPPHLDTTFGTGARNRLDAATDPGREGALAALESFYYAFNQRDLDALRRVWTTDPLAQLNNPLGGILRGGEAITALYGRVFHGPARVTVEFGDIVEYSGEGHAVFAGRETGEYRVTETVPLSIRTTRIFAYGNGRWVQVHHHGSIDDAEALAAYQAAIRG